MGSVMKVLLFTESSQILLRRVEISSMVMVGEENQFMEINLMTKILLKSTTGQVRNNSISPKLKDKYL